MFNYGEDKEKKEKEEKEKPGNLNVPKTYTIKGPNLGDTKKIKIYPDGYIQIIEGGI